MERTLTSIFLAFVAAFILLGHSKAQAANDKTLGAGIVLGSPTALTGKYWQDNSHAIDFGLGYWWDDYLEIYGDYLWHFPRAFSRSHHPFPQFVPYIGVGGDLHIAGHSRTTYDNDHPSVGFLVRIPFGVEWLPPTAPLGVFLELVPAIEVAPGITGALEGGIGIRFYFF